jgi:Oxidoreductase family, NAD-binding Rossmann fold
MSAGRKSINVGLIGCGTRALWYGAIFGDIDPDAYAKLAPGAYHHMTYYMHVEPQVPRAKGFRLTKIYDPDADAAKRIAAAFRGTPDVCESIDDVSKNVDLVFIANDAGDGSGHVSLAEPGLRRGVPTFVDRPFAATVKDAKAMIRLAKRNGAPLLSCSHMRMLPQAARFKARFAEVGPIDQGVVAGSGANPAHVADGVELALFLFGDEFLGRAASVQSMGASPFEVALIEFAKGKAGRSLQVLLHNAAAHDGSAPPTFTAKATSQFAPVDSPDFDAFAQTEGGVGVMEALKRMVATGEAPYPHQALVEPIAVMEAGRISHNRTKAIPLPDVR